MITHADAKATQRQPDTAPNSLHLRVFAATCGDSETHEEDYARRESNPQPMVPKPRGRVRTISLKGPTGKELGTKNRLSKDAVTFNILRSFPSFFNGFCTILYPDFSRFFASQFGAERLGPIGQILPAECSPSRRSSGRGGEKAASAWTPI